MSVTLAKTFERTEVDEKDKFLNRKIGVLIIGKKFNFEKNDEKRAS